MAEVNLKKLSRAELLEMMIAFSEETEAAKKHEEQLWEELEKEKMELQRQMAEERARMLKNFDEEKAQMREKFNQQKAEMQAKFDRDLNGLKNRLTMEKNELQLKVDDSLSKIEDSGNLAEASVKLGGIMESAQKAADLYVKTLQEKAKKEYEEFQRDLENARRQMNIPKPVNEEVPKKNTAEEDKPKVTRTRGTTAKTTTRATTGRKKKAEVTK
ncbi:MAG: hypothetical protein IJU77_05205 [Butyrivibrio sp.]|nr:hypothetical protein [Butyrivibrio sp.]